jgi:ankyrin repeat protein
MEANQVLMISKLLDYGADINALDSDKRSALHHAAEAAKQRVIPVLIQRGAHTSLRDSLMKKTPLEMAANDHIKELMIAYCSPDYMPDEKEINQQSKKKYQDRLVNKKG